jgi:hypothetical protein
VSETEDMTRHHLADGDADLEVCFLQPWKREGNGRREHREEGGMKERGEGDRDNKVGGKQLRGINGIKKGEGTLIVHDSKREELSCILADLEERRQYTGHGECWQHAAAVSAALSGLLSVVLSSLAHLLPQQHRHSAALTGWSHSRPRDELE